MRRHPQPRPLTGNERAVLERMLAWDFEDAAIYRSQLDATTVVGDCGCGCATILLEVDRSRAEPARAGHRRGFVLPVEASEPDGAWLLVHVRHGYLAELESVPRDGDDLRPLPSAESLAVLELH